MATSKRYLSLFLVLAMMLGMFTPTTVLAAESSTAPTNVKMQYSKTTDYQGEYYSDNLKSDVNIRTIRSTYEYGGESVSSYAFCMEHGDGLSSNDSYSFIEELVNYPAAPFIAFMLNGVRNSGWDDTTTQTVQGWVNAIIWLTEAELFTDPMDATQIQMVAEERVAALSAVYPGDHTLSAPLRY